MDAIVICGGQGTRVRSITNDEIPKILIPVNGKPFVEHLISVIYDQGVRNITFAAGFKGEVLKTYIEGRYPRFPVLIEDQPLDTAGGVLNALVHGSVDSNPFLVINGDCLLLPDTDYDSYEHLYYEECWHQPGCAIFTCKTKHDGRYGSLDLAPYSPFSGGMEFITGFKNGEPGESWINCGWYIVRREFFDRCKDWGGHLVVDKLSMEKDMFPVHLGEGNVINAIMINEEQFLEIGTPEALADAERRLSKI